MVTDGKIDTKVIALFLLIFTFADFCYAQNKKQISIIRTKMKLSYLQKLKDSKIKGYVVIHNNDGSDVELLEYSDYYQEVTSNLSSAFGVCNTYFKNRQLLSNTKLFYNEPIGLYKEYNKLGAVVDSINSEKGYNFSINELIKKIKSDYKIDLSIKDERHQSVSRDSLPKTHEPVYVIGFDINPRTVRTITISGKTGGIISDTISDYEE